MAESLFLANFWNLPKALQPDWVQLTEPQDSGAGRELREHLQPHTSQKKMLKTWLPHIKCLLCTRHPGLSLSSIVSFSPHHNQVGARSD